MVAARCAVCFACCCLRKAEYEGRAGADLDWPYCIGEPVVDRGVVGRCVGAMMGEANVGLAVGAAIGDGKPSGAR